MVFQPTLPARGATRHRSFRLWQQSDFNPRSPHGERRFIAIIWRWMCRFQPTLPARGATRRFSVTPRVVHISTHAPRTGSDRHARHRLTPCSQFQPTLPARGATGRGCGRKRLLGLFQPTLPARGATDVAKGRKRPRKDFNPRSPHGERRFSDLPVISGREFQPTLPARGATLRVRRRHPLPCEFQPTLPARGATFVNSIKAPKLLISTHAPRTGSDFAFPALPSGRSISTHAPRTGSVG